MIPYTKIRNINIKFFTSMYPILFVLIMSFGNMLEWFVNLPEKLFPPKLISVAVIDDGVNKPYGTMFGSSRILENWYYYEGDPVYLQPTSQRIASFVYGVCIISFPTVLYIIAVAKVYL